MELSATFYRYFHHSIQECVVLVRKAPSLTDPIVKIGQLDSQQRRLDLVKSAVKGPLSQVPSIHQTMVLPQGNILNDLLSWAVTMPASPKA